MIILHIIAKINTLKKGKYIKILYKYYKSIMQLKF